MNCTVFGCLVLATCIAGSYSGSPNSHMDTINNPISPAGKPDNSGTKSERPSWVKFYRSVYESQDVVGFILGDFNLFERFSQFADDICPLRVPLLVEGIILGRVVHFASIEPATLISLTSGFLWRLDVLQLDSYCKKHSCHKPVSEFFSDSKNFAKGLVQFPINIKPNISHYRTCQIAKTFSASLAEQLVLNPDYLADKFVVEFIEAYLYTSTIDSDLLSFALTKIDRCEAFKYTVHEKLKRLLKSMVASDANRQSVVESSFELIQNRMFQTLAHASRIYYHPDIHALKDSVEYPLLKFYLTNIADEYILTVERDPYLSLLLKKSEADSQLKDPAHCLPLEIVRQILFQNVKLENYLHLFNCILVCKQWRSFVRSFAAEFTARIDISWLAIRNRDRLTKLVNNFKIAFAECTVDEYCQFVTTLWKFCGNAKTTISVFPNHFNPSEKSAICKKLGLRFLKLSILDTVLLVNESLSEDEHKNAFKQLQGLDDKYLVTYIVNFELFSKSDPTLLTLLLTSSTKIKETTPVAADLETRVLQLLVNNVSVCFSLADDTAKFLKAIHLALSKGFEIQNCSGLKFDQCFEGLVAMKLEPNEFEKNCYSLFTEFSSPTFPTSVERTLGRALFKMYHGAE